jgi:hypothetical protein
MKGKNAQMTGISDIIKMVLWIIFALIIFAALGFLFVWVSSA